MFDPRDDIIGLFTNSRIGAVSKYGSNATVYMQLLKTEDDSCKEPNDYGDKTVGIIWFKPPRCYNTGLDIGFSSTEHQVIIDCDMVLPVNDKWLQGVHGDYINNVLHTFETTIRDNATKSGVSYDTAELLNVITDFSIPNINRRIIEILCFKSN
jgi:hypothetical protein